MKSNEFVPTGTGNYYLDAGDFGVSYNPAPWAGFSIFEGDTNAGETALVVNGEFFILNGDYREAYVKLVPKGLSECVRFFLDNEANISSWSDSTEDARALMEV